VVLDACAATVIALDRGDRAGLVGEDRLEAMPVMVGEGQLCAGVRSLAADQDARPGWPACGVEAVGDLCDLSIRALGAVLIKRRNPVLIRDLDDRGANRFGQVIADREPDPGLPRPVEQLVTGPGGVHAQQQLDVLDVLGGDLLDRLLGNGDLVGGGVRAGVARPQLTRERLAGLIGVGEQRVKAEAALEIPRGALLV
jgi:hypothetical protein